MALALVLSTVGLPGRAPAETRIRVLLLESGGLEVVSDEIALSLENVPAGRYQMVVGVYHPETGERLPMVVGGKPMTDGSLILVEEIVR